MIKPNQNIVVNKRGQNSDIIKAIHDYLPYGVEQMKSKYTLFVGKNEKETCRNIWNFLKKNIKYMEDSSRFQDIKLPSRLLKMKIGDCKSFSMFTASVLTNANIPYKFVYTSYTNDKTPSHVYIQTNTGIIVDAVYNKFNAEKPFTYKYLKNGIKKNR